MCYTPFMEALKHLNFFVTTLPAILNHYNEKEVNEVQQFSLGLLRRLEHGSISLKILLEQFQPIPEVDFSAGLIIRAIYLDMLISLNYYKVLKDGLNNKLSEHDLKNKVDLYCKTVLADGLDQTSKYLEQAVSFGFKTAKELREVFNVFAKSYPTYFKDHPGDGSKPKSIFPKADSPTKLFKKLADDVEMRDISGIYDGYLYYSKYDHFGELYFDTHNSSNSEKLKMATKAIRLFTRHCAILYEALDRTTPNDEIVKEEYKKVVLYMTQNKNNGV